jgi:hypothetical protein
MSEPDYDFLREDEADPATPESAPETVETPVVAEAPTASEAPTAPARESDHVPLAALKAEREKRQEAARKAQELERRLAELEAQRTQPAPPAFYENPEQHIAHAVSATEQRLRQQFFAALEASAREAHPDYDDVLQDLQESGNPALVQRVFAAANPALEAYKLGKQLREIKALQDPAAYRASLEAEIRAQIAAEAKAKETARAQAAAAIPPELSAARAAKDADVVVDDSLDSILASRR